MTKTALPSTPTRTRSNASAGRGWADSFTGTPAALGARPRPSNCWPPPLQTLPLWGDELDYPDLADDIVVEARLALHLTEEIKEIGGEVDGRWVGVNGSSPMWPAARTRLACVCSKRSSR
jgi:hypothetical protein